MAGYGTDQGLTDWLTENGLALPQTAPAPAILRQRGSTYVDGLYGDRLPGAPTGGIEQERAYPRSGATVHGSSIPDDAIPLAIIHASYFAAYQEAMKPGVLMVTATAGRELKRVEAGTVKLEFQTGSGSAVANSTPRFSLIEGLMAPFLVTEDAPTGFLLRSIG